MQVARNLYQIPQLTEEEFSSCEEPYFYDRTELEARVESVDEDSAYWRKEKIAFNAAYAAVSMTSSKRPVSEPTRNEASSTCNKPTPRQRSARQNQMHLSCR